MSRSSSRSTFTILSLDSGFGEVIGSRYHGWGEQYEKTHQRKERLQAMGFVICEATPVRLHRAGPALLASLERVYLQYAGRGMPSGVTLLPPPTIAPTTRSNALLAQ